MDINVRFGVIFLKNLGGAVAGVTSKHTFPSYDSAMEYAHCENILHGTAAAVVQMDAGVTTDDLLDIYGPQLEAEISELLG